MKDALAGIGLLRYAAGDLGEGTDQELVYTAVVDLYANKVVSIEPYSWGTNTAKWDWQAYSVVVTDPDGNTNELKLRKPKNAAGRARGRRILGPGGAGGRAATRPQTRRRRRRRRRRRSAASSGWRSARDHALRRLIPRREHDAELAMTLFLASVRDAAEAETALLAGADIIDLKEPAQGALGAVDLDNHAARRGSDRRTRAGQRHHRRSADAARSDPRRGARARVLRCRLCQVRAVSRRRPASLLRSASSRRAARPPHPRAVRRRSCPPSMPCPQRRDMGAAGIMLDTADKHAGSLLAHLDVSDIASFVAHAKAQGLMVGSRRLAQRSRYTGASDPLAGPARLSRRTLPGLRSASLDPASCASIRALIPRSETASRKPSRPQE